jgi:hypothetical protein
MLAFVELHFYPMSTKQRAGHKTCFLFWLFCLVLCHCSISERSEDYGRSRFATSLVSLANVVVRFKPGRGSQEKRPFSNGLFSIQSEGLACNLTAGEYVIAEGVWHHASACILLRIDYIQHFVLIPYRRQAADFIHAYRRDFTSCIFVL